MKAWAAQFTLVTGIHRGYPIYGQHFTHLMCIRKYPSIHLARLPTSSYPTYLYVKVRVEFAYLKTRNLTLQPGLLDKSQRATSIESIRPWVKAVILVAERCLMHCGTGFQERAAPTQSLSLSPSPSFSSGIEVKNQHHEHMGRLYIIADNANQKIIIVVLPDFFFDIKHPRRFINVVYSF